MEAWEVLERAANEMQRRGKCEVQLVDDAGRVCAWGAISVAQGFEPQYSRCPLAVFNMLKLLAADHGGAVCAWSDSNDEPTVIAGLRAGAASLKAQARVATTFAAIDDSMSPAKVRAMLGEL
jgi:hypothetical protein